MVKTATVIASVAVVYAAYQAGFDQRDKVMNITFMICGAASAAIALFRRTESVCN